MDRDENRAEYGKELRYEFLEESGLAITQSWVNLQSSVLEMLIGLARHAAYETGIEVYRWFWIMIENIGLERYTDDVYSSSVHSSVEAIINRVMHRRYQASGRGGFFPLRNPRRDQREVELWYQLSAYIIENYEF